MMTIIAMINVGLFAAVILKSYWRQIRTSWYGTETAATVSLIDEDVIRRGSGQLYGEFRKTNYYVRFINRDGQEAEARLINPGKKLLTGSQVTIRYLPEKENYAVLTGITM